MRIRIEKNIFKKYPSTSIGFVVASIKVNKPNEQTNKLKASLASSLKSIKLTEYNLEKHPQIKAWHTIYKDFEVPETYISSVEALVKRVLSGSLWNISNIVDLYNSCSVLTMLPMGGYDLEKIKGDIVLRYGKAGEVVQPLGKSDTGKVNEKHVVYADDEKVLCWLWNYKDSKLSCIDSDTRQAIFFIDAAFPLTHMQMQDAIKLFEKELVNVGASVLANGILNAKHPEVKIAQDELFKNLPQADRKETPAPAIKESHHSQPEHTEHHGSEEHLIRVQKVKDMREAGIEPWPYSKKITASCKSVHDEFRDDDATEKTYAIAGRVITRREHGKAAFATLQDGSGQLQIYVRQDVIGEEAFEFFKHRIDLGDIIWCTGVAFRTKVGEVTLKVSEFTLLSKSLFPLPEKFHGMTDVEARYRQRYLDLIANPESRERFKKRSAIVRTIRNFLDGHDFMEVETPMLHPIPGGAAARPFMTHHNALDMELFLRIAPELYLKRLVVGGFERVYEINRNFRNEGISTRHNPEFTMLEFYVAHQDYNWMMNFSEELIQHVARVVAGSTEVQFGDHHIDFGKPFKRIAMADAVAEYAGVSKDDLGEKKIDALLKKHNIALKDVSWGQKILALFEALVEPHLIQPTFITQFPVEISPLAKSNPANPGFVDRFELFVAGMELANAFNELNDPFDQAARFQEQAAAHESGKDEEAHRYDADYVHALEYGLPPTVGFGMGIDRLTMMLTNTVSIKDVILFPTLKRK